MRASVSSATNARSSSWWLVPGSCVPLSSASTTRRPLARPSRFVATPSPAQRPPGRAAACSRARATVVPKATTRPKCACIATIAATVDAGSRYGSANGRRAVERRVAGRGEAGGMGERREADAALAQRVEQPPVEDEAGRGRLERDRRPGDSRPHVPERQRLGEVRVLDRTAVPGQSPRSRHFQSHGRLGQAGCANLMILLLPWALHITWHPSK